MSRQFFGTDGIRGLANQEPLSPETVVRVGLAVATYFRGQSSRPQVVLGRDTRLSGHMLECALVSGLVSAGVGAVHLGVMPTPAVAYLTRSLGAVAGIMISASHNPYADNGIKIFQASGYKCDDAMEQALEELIRQPHGPGRPTGAALGVITAIPDAQTAYQELIQRSLPKGFSLRGMRVAVDAANGAAYETAPRILRALGAEVFLFHHEPNGLNINLDCGSTHPEIMTRLVQTSEAHLGISLDGDADRVICCDETGAVVDGDEITAIVACDLLERGELRHQTLVATTQSNLGLEECIQKAGGRVLRTAVGDRYVLEAMLKEGYNFGGEQAGHIIFREINTTSDGLLTALQVLRIMKDKGQPLSALRQCLRKYPQKLVNLTVREKVPLEELPAVLKAVHAAEAGLGTQGRVNLRYSGTEKKIRLLVEGPDLQQVNHWSDSIALVLRSTLG